MLLTQNASATATREKSILSTRDLIAAFDTSGRANPGHSLETAVLNELERRRAEVGYVKTAEGLEVDFLVRYRNGDQELIQVCASLKSSETVARELRALTATAKEHPRAKRRLLVLDRDAAGRLRPQESTCFRHTSGCSPSPVELATRTGAAQYWPCPGNAPKRSAAFSGFGRGEANWSVPAISVRIPLRQMAPEPPNEGRIRVPPQHLQ